MIDIVVGGQFGDEGKGSVAAHLAHEKDYAFSVRVGGSNAEHRFRDPEENSYTSRVLPTAAWIDPDVQLVLGAGHIIKLESLYAEIQDLDQKFGKGHTQSRLIIDEQAGVIAPEHVQQSSETSWRGSTHQGVGAAAAHKVRRDGTFKVAKAYSELRACTGSTILYMHNALRRGHSGLVEGSQGALLSLNHGYYPFCTSKDVTPAALLAEAGIATHWVRDIYAVYRTVPMRVPGNSGPTGGDEISWNNLERLIGAEIPEEVKRQTDSPEGERERVFKWSWADFQRSVILCGPTKLVITFLDWWPYEFSKEEWLNKVHEEAKCPITLERFGTKWSDHKWN